MKISTKQGNRDPVALHVTIRPSDVVPSLTPVTAVSLTVTDLKTGVSETWAVTILAQSSSEITVERKFQQADTATLRTLHIVPWMTITGAANPVAADAFDLEIEAR